MYSISLISSNVLSSYVQLSSDSFKYDTKTRSAWISLDNKKVFYSNETDQLKALEQAGIADEIRMKMNNMRWTKLERLRKQENDVAYAAKKLGYIWILCVFNNVTIETNQKMHWFALEEKFLIVDVIQSLCNNVNSVMYDIVVQRHTQLFDSWHEFENNLFMSFESSNQLHGVGQVHHNDKRSSMLKRVNRMQGCSQQQKSMFDDMMKCGYDQIEHATYDTYHPFKDIGQPMQEQKNYQQDRMLITMPLSVAISQKDSCYYMSDEELRELTKDQIDYIRSMIVYGPYD